MADVLTKKQRSYCMSRIGSKWTAPEIKLHNHLKGLKIRHKMHPKIEGNPDIILHNHKKAVFIHGCFWHKCPSCFVKPKTRTKFWINKIDSNVARDKENVKKLKNAGWAVVILWEHSIRKEADIRSLQLC
ncbi:MAG TPA: very short patch repair endonuclease [archaeon]|nr:very short patch repair endonuclease [archaeon]